MFFYINSFFYVTSFSSRGEITCGGVLNANGGIVTGQGSEINSRGTFIANGNSTFIGTIQANSHVNTGTDSIVDIYCPKDVSGTPTLSNFTTEANNGGALRVRGGMYCHKTMYANGNIIANGNINANGNIIVSKTLNIIESGNLIANGNLFDRLLETHL
jgi:hypothetical protein